MFKNRCTQAIEKCHTDDVKLIKTKEGDIRCHRKGIVTLFSCKRISKRYGSIDALKSAEFSIKAGDIFALCGEKGSGKTTLSMIAAGMIAPDRGERIYKDEDIDQWVKKKKKSFSKEVGIIYQNPADSMNPRFTVYQCIEEPLKIHDAENDKEVIDKKIKNILRDVHLPVDQYFLNTKISELNMGTIQRLSIARAMVLEPQFIIADEPTSSLDPSIQAKVMKLFLDLQIEKGITMLLVTHNIALARKISDYISVMKDGTIIESGRASEIISNPKEEYTKRLLTSAASCRERI
jgi:peptide/nickel transport system ATP-binding protein